MESQYQSRKEVVRLVQKLYNAPLNPDVIRPVSSIMVVPINGDMEPAVLDISEMTNSPSEGEPSDTTSKENTFNVGDNIIFIPPHDDSQNFVNQELLYQEDEQSMSSCQHPKYTQLNNVVLRDVEVTLDVEMEELGQAECIVDDVSKDLRWKDCKQYVKKKSTTNNDHLKREILQNIKTKMSSAVNVGYINIENNQTLLDTGDPMTRLVKVDETRSLLTQEYVSSVLSALDTDLSYSVFDPEKNIKLKDIDDLASFTPRKRDDTYSEAASPVVFHIAVPDSTASSFLKVRPDDSGTSFVKVRPDHGSTSLQKVRPDHSGTSFSEVRPDQSETSFVEVSSDQSYPSTVETRPDDSLKIVDPRSIVEEGCNDYATVETQDNEKSFTWQRLPDDLCRVCAKASTNLIHVFSERGNTLRLADLVHTHLPILVTPDDLLPLCICSSCVARLVDIDTLVHNCVLADSTLRELLEITQSTSVNVTGSESFFDDSAMESNPPQEFEVAESSTMVTDPNPQEPEVLKNGADFSSLLSKEDLSMINKMKGDGLKVTLVRVPNLQNLTEDGREQRVMQIIRTMNMNRCLKKKPIGTISLKSVAGDADQSSAETTDADGSTTNVLSGHSAGSLSFSQAINNERVCATERLGSQDSSAAVSSELNVPPDTLESELSEVMTVTNDALVENQDPQRPKLQTALPPDLMDGINYAIKEGHISKLGTVIKLTSPQAEASAPPSSVYVYVRSKDAHENPKQLPRKILDLDALQLERNMGERKTAAKVAAKLARHQAAIAKRRARLREKRRLISERRALTCEECEIQFSTKEEIQEHRLGHLKCRFCGKQFTKKPNFIEHERVHTKEKPFICDQCGRPFRTRAQMMQHHQRHNRENPYMCQVCGQQFSVRNTYMAHVNRHSSEAPYLCEMCGKCFKVQVALRLHRLTHRTFSCNICDKVFSYRAYQIHKRSHAGEEAKFACTHCNKKFLTIHRLKIHLLIHEAMYPFSCGVCKRAFKRMTHLQAHQIRHTAEQLEGIRFFCCAVCHVHFEQPSELSQHLKTHTDEERQCLKSFKCDTCNKCFSLERELRTHELRHAGKQTFSCGTCERAFDTKREFDEHSDTHTEEKPFACQVCGKRFRTLLNLNNHQQIHLSIKPYPCQSCPKAFKTINGLNQHKVVHSDVRKHTCSICSMGFKRRDAMKNHERTHFAERPYACSVCGRAFKVKADCSTHIKRHREAGIEGSIMESCYTCPVCSANFTLKIELSSHVQNAHDLEVAVLDKSDNFVLVPEVDIF